MKLRLNKSAKSGLEWLHSQWEERKKCQQLGKKICNIKIHTKYVIWRFMVVVVMRTSQLFESQDPEAFCGNWELKRKLVTWRSSCFPKQWQNSCVLICWQIQNQICFGCPMQEAYLTSKKEVTSGHSANKHTAQLCFHCFPKQWQNIWVSTHDETNMSS